MPAIREFFYQNKRLWQQRQEINRLQNEVSALRAQNDSMREGMRRCVTCEYRIDYKTRQGDTSTTEDSEF